MPKYNFKPAKNANLNALIEALSKKNIPFVVKKQGRVQTIVIGSDKEYELEFTYGRSFINLKDSENPSKIMGIIRYANPAIDEAVREWLENHDMKAPDSLDVWQSGLPPSMLEIIRKNWKLDLNSLELTPFRFTPHVIVLMGYDLLPEIEKQLKGIPRRILGKSESLSCPEWETSGDDDMETVVYKLTDEDGATRYIGTSTLGKTVLALWYVPQGAPVNDTIKQEFTCAVTREEEKPEDLKVFILTVQFDKASTLALHRSCDIDDRDYEKQYFNGKPLLPNWIPLKHEHFDKRQPIHDFLRGHRAAPYVSQRVYEYLAPLVGEHAQFRPIGIVKKVQYYVMNVVTVVDCLDMKKSGIYVDLGGGIEFENPPKMVFDPKRITDAPVFKVPQNPYWVLVSPQFVKWVREARFTGIAFENPADIGIYSIESIYPDMPFKVTGKVKESYPERVIRDTQAIEFKNRISDADHFGSLFSMDDPDRGTILEENEIRYIDAGLLNLPSGVIVAGDALADPCIPPIALKVKPGKYPVTIAITSLTKGDERVAAAMIRVADKKPVKWGLARMKAGRDENDLEFGVDSGTGCYMSKEACKYLMRKHDDSFIETVAKMLSGDVSSGTECVEVWIDKKKELNAVFFSAGYGDGTYYSYWGLDEKDNPVCLITDFGILSDTQEGEKEYQVIG